MKKIDYLLGFVCTCLTIYVTGCGDNPTKTRIMMNSMDTNLSEIPSATLTSIDGRVLKFQKGKADFIATAPLGTSQASFSYDYETDEAEMTLRSGHRITLKGIEFAGVFDSLRQDLETQSKSTGLSPLDARTYSHINTEWSCHGEFPGLITKWIERPKGSLEKFAHSQEKDLFTAQKMISNAILIELAQEPSRYQIQMAATAHAVLDEVLQKDTIAHVLHQNCAEEFESSNASFNFFLDRQVYDSYSSTAETANTFLLGIENFSNKEFKISNGQFESEPTQYTFEGFTYFVAPNHVLDLTDAFKKRLPKNTLKSRLLKSRSLVGSSDPYVTIQWDWDRSEIHLQRQGTCGYSITGKMAPAQFRVDDGLSHKKALTSSVTLLPKTSISKSTECENIQPRIDGRTTFNLQYTLERRNTNLHVSMVDSETNEPLSETFSFLLISEQ